MGVIPPPPCPPAPLPFPDQPLLSKISPFLEIQNVPTFYSPIRKTEVLNDSFNRFRYNFYPQSTLIWEEYLKSGELQI